MSIIRNTIDYVKDKEFKITIKKNYIDIENYNALGEISENEMIIYNLDKKIKILGNSLRIKKLLNNEVLIIGDLSKILLEDNNE